MISTCRMVLTKHLGEDVYKIARRIAAPRAFKITHGGLKAFNNKPSSMTIWRRQKLNGQRCIFDDIKEYLEMATEIHKTIPKFFFVPSIILEKCLPREIEII